MLFRVGQGFDIHNLSFAQKEEPQKPFLLGGVVISKQIGVTAHSDGDTLLHALIDSILGALGKEDIGDLFPPNSKEWEDIDSQELLKIVLSQTNYQQKWNFNNIDITIVLQEPKLGVLKANIKDNLRKMLDLPEGFPIAIKAKTFEKKEQQVWIYSTILLNLTK